MQDAICGYYRALETLEDSPWMFDEAARKLIRHLRANAPDMGEAAIVALGDAAARLGMSRRNLQRCIAQSLIRGCRRSGRLYFTEAELDRFRNIPRRGRGRPKRPPLVIWQENA